MKRVAFFTTHMNEMGTETATYDYAYHNQKTLGNVSIIFYIKNRPTEVHSPHIFNRVLNKYQTHFEVIALDRFEDIHQILLDKKVDAFYVLKGGELDEYQTTACKCCIHCVWGAHLGTKHGDAYADINAFSSSRTGSPYVPHMVNLPDSTLDMRDVLGIPKDAIVFGGYGAPNSLDLEIAYDAIYNVAKNNPHIYFLFANGNIKKFPEALDNVIHLDAIIDLEEKAKFINTIDVMVHGRSLGETFGLAIAEFSSKNKPVITASHRHIYKGEVEGATIHLKILGDRAILYDTQAELEHILQNFDRQVAKSMDWNCYTDYEPEKVMKLFKEVFLDD